MEKPPFKIGTLGEIAIRCTDIIVMADFYESTLGLTRLPGNTRDDIIFFMLSEGFEGHTTVLALFANDTTNQPNNCNAPKTGTSSSLHHIALSLSYEEQKKAIAWYDKINQSYSIEHFNWISWRGVFTQDPEGNTVELVAKMPD